LCEPNFLDSDTKALFVFEHRLKPGDAFGYLPAGKFSIEHVELFPSQGVRTLGILGANLEAHRERAITIQSGRGL
jgi:hypothetical protein